MCGSLSPTSRPYPPLRPGRQDPSKTTWTTSRPMRSSRVFAKQLPRTRLYLDLVSLGASGTNVQKVDSVKQRQDVTRMPLIRGTPDVTFIYTWRRMLTHRFPWLSAFLFAIIRSQ